MNHTITLADPQQLPTAPDSFARFFAEVTSLPPDNQPRIEYRLLSLDGGPTIPLVINHGRADTGCYLTSPYCHYFQSAVKELCKIPGSLSAGARCVVSGLGGLFRLANDCRIVYVNNMLFATNPTIPLSADDIASVTEYLKERFPRYAICFRSVDSCFRGKLAADLQHCGYDLLFNRRIFAWFPDRAAALNRVRRQELAVDRRLLAKSDYRMREISAAEDAAVFERISHLYRLLYVERHSHLNPRLGPQWFLAAARHPRFRVVVLQREDQVDGVTVTYEDDQFSAGCWLGYDTSIDRRTGLYRMLVTEMLRQAQSLSKPAHLSSGVGRFKELRGAEGWPEYEAVYCAHLNLPTRMSWRLLARYFGPAAELAYRTGRL